MKSPFCFIVKPQGGMRYDNLSKHGDGKLITSSSQEDHTATNRFATVEEVPILWAFNKNIKKGDTVVVHHNIFRKYYDMKGVEKSGPCHFKDDLYLVDIDQVYLHKSKDKWSSVGDYCFIKPTEKEKDVILSVDRNKQLVGKEPMIFVNHEFMKEARMIGWRAHLYNRLPIRQTNNVS